MIRRLALLAVVVAIVVGLGSLDEERQVASSSASPQIGALVSENASNATWYCTAGVAGDEEPPVHQIIITNTGAAGSARVTGYRTTSEKTTSIDVKVPAKSQVRVKSTDVAPDIGSIVVELDGVTAVVAHRLVNSESTDQADCLTSASTTWYFPTANTETGSQARLWLLNPFPTDASVDISVTTPDGVRVPEGLRGIIVPPASFRMVELGQSAQRREQFAFTAETRGGRVIAELAQSLDSNPTGGPRRRGLALMPGIARAGSNWIVADSFGGTGVSEQVIVYNPKSDSVSAAVSVVVNDVPAEAQPEPFVLEIGPRNYEVVNIDTEARVPPGTLRWIRVDGLNGAKVVTRQAVRVAATGGDGTAATRPQVALGFASNPGASSAATRWLVSSVDPGTQGQSAVVIANPSSIVISVATVRSIREGAVVDEAKNLEVPPGSSLVVDVSEAAGKAPLAFEVASSSPVVVSGRTTSNDRRDLSMWSATPISQGVESLPPSGS